MIKRLDYNKINPDAIKSITSAQKHVSSIAKKIKVLVELRVSQINGCAYCLDYHAREARKLGEKQQRLDCLNAWSESNLFSAKECAAIDWAEVVTKIGKTHAPKENYNNLQNYFSEKQIVDLTLIISLMNTMSRLAISFRNIPNSK